MEILTQGFNPGAVPDRHDSRDYQWEQIAGAAGVPTFDWYVGYDVEAEIAKKLGVPSFKIPTKNQNGSGSCGGQAWAYYGATLECLNDGSYEERSAKFIYAQTFYPTGGSTGRDNCNVAIKQGWAREAVLTSYDNGMPPSEAFMTRAGDITDVVRADASSAKALSYANVAPAIDTLAQAIAANAGVIIGIAGQNNGTWSGMFPQPPATPDWWHWLYACKAKLINGKKYIGVKNSWGDAIGDGGIQWLGEDYFKPNLMLNNWTLTFLVEKPKVRLSYIFTQPVVYGQRSEAVKALQIVLKSEGFLKANVTGYYGDLTARALFSFQVEFRVAPLPELTQLKGLRAGAKTIAMLNELIKQRSYIVP